MAQTTPYLLNALPSSSYVKLWGATAPVLDGTATFYPTEDGTPAGQPIFTNPHPAISLTAERDTSDARSVPFASVRRLSPDQRTLDVNVVAGAQLQAQGGDTLVPAPDGTVVHCVIIGI